MFKKGDRVRYVGAKEHYKGECGKLSCLKNVKGSEEVWTIEFSDWWLQELDVTTDEIELIIRKPEKYKDCECGAWADRGFENNHSDWCKMYGRKV